MASLNSVNINQPEEAITNGSAEDQKEESLKKMEDTMKDLTVDDLIRGSTPADIEKRCLDLCRAYLGGSWEMAKSVADITTKRISGGMTNQLYHVKLNDEVPRVKNEVYPDEPQEVAIKLYQAKHMKSHDGQDHERLTDIIVLTIVSEVGIGPKVYGIFTDGVILAYHKHEQFRVKHQKNPVLLKELAGVLAHIHHLNVPIRKNNNWLLKEMRSMIELGYSCTDVQGLVQEFNLEQFKVRDLIQEFDDFEQIITNAGAPQVFCHNDFRGSNILVTEDNNCKQKILLCDLEYASYGPRGFDLAVFLTEWGRKQFDMTDFGMPPDEPIRNFVHLYLDAVESIAPGYKAQPENNFERMVKETKLCFLANFMFFIAFIIKQTESIIPQIPSDPKNKMIFVNKIYAIYFRIKNKLIQDGVIE